MKSKRLLVITLTSALLCIVFSIVFGFLSSLYYIPELAEFFKKTGFTLQQLRPLHTTYASSWIFLGAIACIWKYLCDERGELQLNDFRHWRFQLICWMIAGSGIMLTVPFGLLSGREYIGFHPVFSIFIMLGWLSFTYVFFKKTWRIFWSGPIYLYMWGIGILYFIYTFAEGHAWLIPGIYEHPVADLQIQWKSCGTLVASFNQMVYGCLFYITEKISGDTKIARSNKAFWFFCIGLLNSFTNYAHHTYHLPQDHLIKWIAFVVSMLEIILLFSVLTDVVAIIKKRSQGNGPQSVEYRFLELAKCWNLFLLFLALLISIPPLNALIHGTHVVMAHAMGSEIAIDTFILFAVVIFLYEHLLSSREESLSIIQDSRLPKWVNRLNFFLICLIVLLLYTGLNTGIARVSGQVEVLSPRFPFWLALLGSGFGYYLLKLLGLWLPPLLTQISSKK